MPEDGTPHRVTLTVVAERARVHPSIVSRVINDDRTLRIREDTRQRILDVVRELDYRPNAAARSLKTAHAGTIALFIPDFENPVYAQIIAGAEAEAGRSGTVLVTGSSGLPGRSGQAYRDLVGSGRVDGVLLAGGALNAADLSAFDAAGVPYLQVNRRGRGTSRFVILDDDRASQVAVNHLLSLGHRDIAFIGGPGTADTARRRRSGFLTAMRKAGDAEPEPLCVQGDYTPAGGFAAFSELRHRTTMPTAVFVANVASAIGVLKAARASGLRVPDDLSVVAVHDLPIADFLTPALTTVRMPLRQLGEQAVRLLLDNSPTAAVRQTVSEPIELVARDSTAPPRLAAS